MKNLFNLSLIISNILILSACADSSSSNDTDRTRSDHTDIVNTHINSFEISGIGSTTDLNKSGKYDLEISGIENIVTIKRNNTIDNLEISGVANTVYIELNTWVSNLTVSGRSNVIYVPLNSKISFTDEGVGNELKTQTTNSILGNWSYTYPDTQCVVSYLFNTNGTFSGTSLDEVFSGAYSFEKTVVTGIRHSLTIRVSADNALANCKGTSSDRTGKTETTYINFSSSNTMQWYTELTGTSDTTGSFLKK
jgi:hypothetical protein